MLNLHNIKINNMKVVAPIPVAGPNYALQFDGINEYVQSASNLGITGASNWTIACWHYATTWTKQDTIISIGLFGVANKIVAIGQGPGDAELPANNQTLLINLWSAQNYNVDIGINMESDWTHIAATYDGTNIRIYGNGTLKDTRAKTVNLTDNTCYIGGRTGGYNGQYVNGKIDEAAVWGRKLSDNDISDLYNGGTGRCINPSGTFPTDGGSMGTNLVMLYHLNDGTGLVATDSSGNGNNGNLTNMDNTNWVTGKVQC